MYRLRRTLPQARSVARRLNSSAGDVLGHYKTEKGADMQGHINLSSHATDERDLYEIWDKDLKKCIRRREILEILAVAWVVVCGAGIIHPGIEWFVGVLVALAYGAARQFVDESNVNYLLHHWDLRNALQQFRCS
jgi:hypothetical protein